MHVFPEQAETARLVEQVQPFRHEAERQALAFLVVRLLVNAHKHIASLHLEAEKAIGADREHGIDRAAQSWCIRTQFVGKYILGPNAEHDVAPGTA